MEVTVKSAEQKLTEKATEEYISKLQAIYGNDACAEVKVSGVRLSKLGHIAECANLEIKSRPSAFYNDAACHYLRKPFTGEGYTITEISE